MLNPIDKNCIINKYKLINGNIDIIKKNLILLVKKNMIPGFSCAVLILNIKSLLRFSLNKLLAEYPIIMQKNASIK